MNGDDKTLGELFREAAGGAKELKLEDGRTAKLTVMGNIVVDEREVGELGWGDVERIASELRLLAARRYLDPANNDFIKLDPD